MPKFILSKERLNRCGLDLKVNMVQMTPIDDFEDEGTDYPHIAQLELGTAEVSHLEFEVVFSDKGEASEILNTKIVEALRAQASLTEEQMERAVSSAVATFERSFVTAVIEKS